jgi:ABC-type multidrug transport system permease subunit
LALGELQNWVRLSSLGGLLAFFFLGALVAFLAKSHQDKAALSSLILLPATFLGGTFFPQRPLCG